MKAATGDEMTDIGRCSTITSCLYDYQTLASGILAIVAAVITAIVIWRAAKLPLVEQKNEERDRTRKKLIFAASVLSREFLMLRTRAGQVEGTIQVAIAANSSITERTREMVLLKIHSMVDDWDFMEVIPSNRLDAIERFCQLVADHNFDMLRAAGAFGDMNFRRSILDRVKKIEADGLHLANQLASLSRVASDEPSSVRSHWLSRALHRR